MSKEDLEIEEATKVHRDLRATGLDASVVLAKPRHRIFTPLGERHPVQIVGKNERPTYPASQPRKPIDLLRSHDDWIEGGDHDLLFSMLDRGRHPERWLKGTSEISKPPAYREAVGIAEKRGYKVLKNNCRPVGWAEREAWAAAQLFILGYVEKFAVADRLSWRGKVLEVTGQFIVPDPLEDHWKCPFFIDQLWIVKGDESSVRLVGLEIDEPIHREPQRIKRDAERDLKLGAIGYEMFRVDAQWFKIDPFRAITEFLVASEIYPDALGQLVAGHFHDLEDYHCDLCGQPMIRKNLDWICEVQGDAGNTQYVHRSCAGT